ncbi:phage tail tape measure protein [Pseudomonas sp. KSR10]|uniref:phage tail tape measure protein n=1 Tax=Pseudomonas sp. KSR10 TaxID=2916654 RepID=UPI001EF91720|nr:phage tail tape measure protein [Pseudomonas sp. KSR10]MCG6541751.1 phage tail tape measure protein [Pseudomonas sp. KSR10]
MIQIEATTAQLRREMALADKSVATATRGIDKQLSKIDSAFDRVGLGAGKLTAAARAVAPAMAALVTIEGLRRARQLSEEFTLLEARVRRLGGGTAEAAVTYARLAEISGRTGVSLADTVKLWESLTGTLQEMGATDAQVVRLAETLQKIGTIGGSSSEEVSSALRQLGQGLAGGVIRAEEFNSVIEGMPELGREIARGLGVPFGELRQLMLDGKLTAEAVLGAIQSRAGDVDREFAKLPRTVDQASNALTTNFGRAVADLDKAIGGSKNLAWLIDKLATGIRLQAGDLTDLERLNELTTERARLQERYAQADRRTLLSAKERATFEEGLKKLNTDILEIQDRRIGQLKDEGKQIKSSGESRNAEYDKYLAKLKESAALQGTNTEEAKVRYAIEAGELGKLTDKQQQSLLAYAKEKDAKVEAEKTAKTHASAIDKTNTSYKSLVASLEKQIYLLGQEGESAEMAYQLEHGGLKDLDPARKTVLRDLANELEAKKALAEAADEMLERDRERLAMADRLAAQRTAIDLDVAGVGMGDREIEQLTAVNEVRQRFAQERLELTRNQNDKDRALSAAAFEARMADLRTFEEREIALVEEGAQRKLDAQSDWGNGARRAMENYRDSAADIAGQVDGLFTNAFSSMEDSIVSFATTGKASFKDFATSILEDMARIATRQASSQLLGMLVQAGASYFGGATAGSGAAASDYTGSAYSNWAAAQAKGGAWSGGAQFFAKGGAFTNSIVNQPTAFGMAGGLGVMGEAGPEAIMPLTRGPDGSLGIQAYGGGSSGGAVVQLNAPIAITMEDRSSEGMELDQEALSRNMQREFQQVAQKVVADSWRPGGISYRQTQGRA